MLKLTVYFVPGLAASKEIFEHISLPDERYDIEILDWLIPEKRESLQTYAARMAQKVTKNESVLVGVSFGGVVAQEMAKYLDLKKLIIVSSVKTRFELPKRLKFARTTRFFKLVPTSIVVRAKDLRRFAVGPRSRKRLHLYNQYLHVRDKRYLDWAIKQMVCWDRTIADEDVVHIHGDRDVVFPVRNISNCEIVNGGTHVMILYKAKEVSRLLRKSIENS